MLWRWRWLLEVGGSLRRLAGARAEGGGDERTLRAMQADLRATRRQVQALATVERDAADLAAIPGVGGQALAVALRLRGASLRAAAAAGATTPASLGRAIRALASVLEAAPPAEVRGVDPTAPAPLEGAPVPSACPGDPGPDAAGGPRAEPRPWFARVADLRAAVARLRLAVAAGRLPASPALQRLWPGRGRGAEYILLELTGPVAAVWADLRGCGIALLAPAGGP